MERNYKITIPEPCTENWDKMTPNESGRFCMSCAKTVIDFTEMLPDEVKHFFVQNQGEKICGRFKNSQLETITIQIPSRVLYSQTQYHKMFLLALFVVMGTTLFSCQDQNGNKQKIDKVEVVNEPQQEIVVGKTLKGSDHIPPPPPPKVDAIKFIKPKEKINTKKASYSETVVKCEESKEKKLVEDEIYNGYTSIEAAPVFPGGIEQFYTFFANEFKKPENSNTTNLKIKITFAVERDGSLSYINSITPIDQTLETEIIRVLKLSPKWQPGESNGKKIKMQYSMPITLE